MQVALPRLGNGVDDIFNRANIDVQPAMGRLKIAERNFKASSAEVRQDMQSKNAKVARDAVEKPTLLITKG